MRLLALVLLFVGGVASACAARPLDPVLKADVKGGHITAETAFAADDALVATEQAPAGVSVSTKPRRSLLDYPVYPLRWDEARVAKNYGRAAKSEQNCRIGDLKQEGTCWTYETAGPEGKTAARLQFLDGHVVAVSETASPLGAPSPEFPIDECARITQLALAATLRSFGAPDEGFPLRRTPMSNQQGWVDFIVTEATLRFTDGSAIYFQQLLLLDTRTCVVRTTYYAPGATLYGSP